VLREPAQERFGFGEGESQRLEPVAVCRQHRHFLAGVRWPLVRTNAPLPLSPQVTPAPLDFLIRERTLPSLGDYPQAFAALWSDFR
jgi:hypothetical protein